MAPVKGLKRIAYAARDQITGHRKVYCGIVTQHLLFVTKGDLILDKDEHSEDQTGR